MHELVILFKQRVAFGLLKKTLTDAARYAEMYRIMGSPFPGPWTWTHHPWLLEPHKSNCPKIVVRKGAQLGFTEFLLNKTFFKIDVERVDCLYVLPSKTPDAKDFSAGRFDPALELSPHLSSIFSDVKNIGHKRAGNTNLYVRGSKSRAGLKSIPISFLALDEVDEFNQSNIPLAEERLSGQKSFQEILVSTPTLEDVGISKHYKDSSKESFFFKCPSCSKLTTLVFPECLEITAVDENDRNIDNSFLKCKECKAKLDHDTKTTWLNNGLWVPENQNSVVRGFSVSQLFSMSEKARPSNLALSYLKAQRDRSEEQSFWNDKMGMPHAVEGARLTDHQLEQAKGDYLNHEYKRKDFHLITMGIDVGTWIHFEIDAWWLPHDFNSTDLSSQALPKVLYYGKVKDFDALDRLLIDNRVQSAVIDALPERRKSFEFASKFPNHVKMCFYGPGIQGKQIHSSRENEAGEPTIVVDRTSWLDLSLGRFRSGNIKVPANIDLEYREHLKALTRVYEKDKDGNSIGRYVKTGDDHYAHARNYAEIALPFAAYMAAPQNMKSPL